MVKVLLRTGFQSQPTVPNHPSVDFARRGLGVRFPSSPLPRRADRPAIPRREVGPRRTTEPVRSGPCPREAVRRASSRSTTSSRSSEVRWGQLVPSLVHHRPGGAVVDEVAPQRRRATAVVPGAARRHAVVFEDRDDLLGDRLSVERVEVPPVHGWNHSTRRSPTRDRGRRSGLRLRRRRRLDRAQRTDRPCPRTEPATAFGRRGAVTVRGRRPWLLSPPRRHEIPEGPT